ncbi:uncharacterized protein SAPINGB_P000076 [Magnusiomyces paraingens]|uniref:Uncharacterized protein n=1 Tax=Magnusiomyces paraingens TaxID=2606893 RepID=A0A5E8AYF5_9ASCO|nr:uncharacterized protein SAPINGB_P000076 [Saprochaete ingens]VVT43639.1 unnamed protein product [Saprochaete ingens]
MELQQTPPPPSQQSTSHKRRHNSTSDDVSTERAKRRLISTFEHLSLGKNNAKTPGTTHNPFGLAKVIPKQSDTSSKRLEQPPVTPAQTPPIKQVTQQQQQPPALAQTHAPARAQTQAPAPETDYMDTSGPHTVFIPSIDDFLAAEGTSSDEFHSSDVDNEEDSYTEDDSELESEPESDEEDRLSHNIEHKRRPYSHSYTGINTSPNSLNNEIGKQNDDEDAYLDSDSDEMDTDDEFGSLGSRKRGRGSNGRATKKLRLTTTDSDGGISSASASGSDTDGSRERRFQKRLKHRQKKQQQMQIRLARKGLLRVPVSVLGPRAHWYQKPSLALIPYVPAQQVIWGHLLLTLQREAQEKQESARRAAAVAAAAAAGKSLSAAIEPQTSISDDAMIDDNNMYAYDSPEYFYSDSPPQRRRDTRMSMSLSSPSPPISFPQMDTARRAAAGKGLSSHVASQGNRVVTITGDGLYDYDDYGGISDEASMDLD